MMITVLIVFFLLNIIRSTYCLYNWAGRHVGIISKRWHGFFIHSSNKITCRAFRFHINLNSFIYFMFRAPK